MARNPSDSNPGDDERTEDEGPGEPFSLEGALERVWGREESPSGDGGADHPTIEEGGRIDDFALIRRLGKGGMGEVWEAEQRSLRRRVALKILPGRRASVDRKVLRFMREAQAGGRLRHPNIVAVYANGESHGCHFIVQELVPGGSTLADFIRDMRAHPEFPPDYDRRIAGFVTKVARALQAAHDAGVIHRDVKPQNILVDERDEPKVADFGLARVTDEDSLSQTGDFMGTYSYMSPEQAASRRMGIDHRTDVFSLGTTLYELITLNRAFDGETSHEITEKIIYVDPPSPRAIRPTMARDLAVICQKAIEKRREHRYGSMAELADDLDRFLAHEPIHARPAGPWLRAQKLVRRRPTLTTAAALLLVALLVIVPLAVRGSSAISAQERAELNQLVTQAQLLVMKGDLAGATARIEEADLIAPDDPTGHVVLALAHVGAGNLRDAQNHIEIARARGIVEDPDQLVTAEDHLAYAALLLSDHARDAFPEVEQHLLQALDRNADLPGAYYALFQMRATLGDDAGALAALEEAMAGIPSRRPLHAVMDAQRLELLGRPEEAIQVLLALEEEVRSEIPIDRDLARLHARTGAWEEAEAAALRAVGLEPGDCSTWSLAALAVAESAAPGADLEERLLRAEEHADRALACRADEVPALAARALVGVERYGHLGRSADQLAEAEARLEPLRALDADEAAAVESRLRRYEGELRYATGDLAGSWERYEQAIALAPENYHARLGYAQRAQIEGLYAVALEQLEAARLLVAPLPDAPSWLFIVDAWIFGTAPHLGEVERARTARVAADRTLASHPDHGVEDLVTYAEFLALGPVGELQDCVRAREVLEVHDVRGKAGGRRDVLEIVARIEAACP